MTNEPEPTGDHFVWFELFIDGFGSYTTRTRNTTGIYVSFANLRNEVKYTRKYIYTVSLIPKGVALADALVPLVEELQKLEDEGVEVEMYPTGERVRVHASIAYILSDHVQACSTIGHIGNNAIMNCRCCLVEKDDRCLFSKALLDHDMTRNEGVSAAQRRQMQWSLAGSKSKSQSKTINTEYGLYPESSPLSRILNVHGQIMPCVGHAIDLGLGERLVRSIIRNLTEDQVVVFKARLANIAWPRGWSAVTYAMLTKSGKLAQPMSTCRKMLMLAGYLLEGLVNPELIDLCMGLVKLRGMIMKRGHTDESVAATVTFGEKWIEDCLEVCTHEPYKLKMDLPNMHLLIEILVRFLPMTKDMRCTMTNRFEAWHAFNKQRMSRMKSNFGSEPETFALRQGVINHGLKFGLEGGGWGPLLAYRAGAGFKELIALSKARGKPFKLFETMDLTDKDVEKSKERELQTIEEDSEEKAVVNEEDGRGGDDLSQTADAMHFASEDDVSDVAETDDSDVNSEVDGSDGDGYGDGSEVDSDSGRNEESGNETGSESGSESGRVSGDDDDRAVRVKGSLILQGDWRHTKCVRVQVEDHVNKSVDDHEPTKAEMKLLQQSINEYYPKYPVSLAELDPGTITYKWVTGFRENTRRDQVFMNGDDVATISDTGTQYGTIQRCLELTLAETDRVYFFIFIRWYKKSDESKLKPNRPSPPILKNWKDNSKSWPITPESLLHRVWIVHNCVRMCHKVDTTRGVMAGTCPDPLSCICNSKCRPRPCCAIHPNGQCVDGECDQSDIVSKDCHNPELGEFLLFDSDWNFQDLL